MRRILTLLLALSFAGLLQAATYLPADAQDGAQATQSRQGEPPIASLITVSSPDEGGNVTISGAAGAVFPGAQVAIRNLYTGQLIYASAGITGMFTAQIFATGSTPFWISASPVIPAELRDRPGSMPGGPGTIIFSTTTGAQSGVITRLVMDGDLADWAQYPQAASPGGEVFALKNRDSVYVAVQSPLLVGEYDSIRLFFALDDASYVATLRRDSLRSTVIRQTAPSVREREAAVNLAFGTDTLELRFPLSITDRNPARAVLSGLALLDAAGEITAELAFEGAAMTVEENVGAVYADNLMQDSASSFYLAGALAQGASYWMANGRIDALAPAPGETLTLELDTTLLVPTLPLTTTDLQMQGELFLQPVDVSALYTNNGWSSVLTRTGLAIDNLRGDVPLGTATTDWAQITRLSDRLVFGLRFTVTVPANLPAGVYIPVFRGYVITPDGKRTPWSANGIFGTGSGNISLPETRLPLTLNIGSVSDSRLYWALFYDTPSDGSRGLLADEDAAQVALSNRVKFNSSTYILPPGTYPVEPYLPNLLPNDYQATAAPLIPLLFPGGRLTGEITRPDGIKDNLGSVAVVQNRLSTAEVDEQDRFGAESPVDLYRLTTLNSLFTAYDFNQYGEYVIQLTGQVEDRSGNRYNGGGTYRLLIAELLDLKPGTLPGTPFEVGNHFYPGVHVTPGVPAAITVTLRFFPLDGGDPVTQVFEGQANAYGHFIANGDTATFAFTAPGEYVVDYEARYTDAAGKLWAASLRGAGVIARPDTGLLVHGERGLQDYTPVNEARPAWFTVREYPRRASEPVEPRLQYPYHPGDVAIYADVPESGINPVLQVQDLTGTYATWLRDTVGINRAADSLPLVTLTDGALPPPLAPDTIVNDAYAYISAVTPEVAVRQFVSGDDTPLLGFNWNADEPLNGQIGAGFTGTSPGDYVFLFGGAVVRNAAAGLSETSIYAALGLTGFIEGDQLATRVYPPYRGGDGGVLLRAREEDYVIFFHPTGTLPGQVLTSGETLLIAGQTAPTLQNQVIVTVTSPTGKVTRFSGLTNTIGYFYDPTHNLAVNEIGVWTIEVKVSPASVTSAGMIEPPLPVGGVPGAVSRRYNVYVTRPGTEPLTWNRNGDLDAETPAAGLFNFTMNIPAGLTDITVYRTVTIPGFILEDGVIPSTPNTAGYQYSPPQLSRLFPALEATGRGTDAAASDVVTLTFAVVGSDSSGRTQVYTRTFNILHNRIISIEGEQVQ